jgi:hypothetical protein
VRRLVRLLLGEVRRDGRRSGHGWTRELGRVERARFGSGEGLGVAGYSYGLQGGAGVVGARDGRREEVWKERKEQDSFLRPSRGQRLPSSIR